MQRSRKWFALAALGFMLLWAPAASSQASTCTPETPCRVRVLIAYTMEGLAQLERAASVRLPQDRAARLRTCTEQVGNRTHCFLAQVATADQAALTEAFRISGITDNDRDGAHRSIVFDFDLIPVGASIDARESMRIDRDNNYVGAASFNACLLKRLGARSNAPDTCNPTDRSSATHWARGYQIVVVFTGLRSPNGCIYNSIENDGVILIPACMTRGYFNRPVPQAQLMLLHEIGHTFGAAHNDNARPQPCGTPLRGLSATGCAWEQCLRPRCDLRTTTDAFCTLVSQYNTTDTFCRVYRRGEGGTGWIREYSHPDNCATEGYRDYPCGDARHNARDAMRERAWTVAHSQASAPR